MEEAFRELALGASQWLKPLNPPMRVCEEQDACAALRRLRGLIEYIGQLGWQHGSMALRPFEGMKGFLYSLKSHIRHKEVIKCLILKE